MASPGILVWVVPLLVAGLGAWRPALGLLVFVASLPLFGAPPAGPYFGALTAAAIAAVLAVSVRLRSFDRPPPDPLAWPLGAWVCVSLVSMIPLLYRPPSWNPGTLLGVLEALGDAEAASPLYSWRVTLDLLLGAALYWACRRAFAEKQLRALGVAAAVAVSYVVALGIGGYVGLVDLSGFRAVADPQLDSRLHSLFFHSGWLAQFLVLATPLAVAGILRASLASRAMALLLAGGSLIAAICTLQRGAWVAVGGQLVATMGLMAWRAPGRSRLVRAAALLVLLAIGGLVALGATRPTLFRQLLSRYYSSGETLSKRVSVWRASTRLLEGRALLGIGPGSFGVAFPKVNPKGERGPRWETAHSVYVNTLVEKGILGLGCLLLVVWTTLRILSRRLVRGPPGRSAMPAGVAISLFGIGIYGFVQHLFFISSIHWLCWILLAAASRIDGKNPARSEKRLAQALIVGTALLLPLRIGSPSTVDGPAHRAYGFHLREMNRHGEIFRWTGKRAAERLPWEGEALVVELFDGHPRAASRALSVTLKVDGQVRWKGPVSGSWQQAAIRVGAPTKSWLVLEVIPSVTFRPFQDFRNYPELESRDIRRLGVVVGKIFWRE